VGEIHFKIRYFCTTQGSSGDFASAATWHVLDGSYHRFIDTSPIDQLVEHIGLKFFFLTENQHQKDIFVVDYRRLTMDIVALVAI
jgi:hypothetical protein